MNFVNGNFLFLFGIEWCVYSLRSVTLPEPICHDYGHLYFTNVYIHYDHAMIISITNNRVQAWKGNWRKRNRTLDTRPTPTHISLLNKLLRRTITNFHWNNNTELIVIRLNRPLISLIRTQFVARLVLQLCTERPTQIPIQPNRFRWCRRSFILSMCTAWTLNIRNENFVPSNFRSILDFPYRFGIIFSVRLPTQSKCRYNFFDGHTKYIYDGLMRW